MQALIDAILADDPKAATGLLDADPKLAGQSFGASQLYDAIAHWMYAGDTVLHLAAAAYRNEIVALLLDRGADPLASGRRGGAPLHYAADGLPGARHWNPERQERTIRLLVDAGAEVGARDKNGATALHRAVRTRSSRAVACLLELGCDAGMRNKSGSTAFHLAVQNTGRGGTGSNAAQEAQREIIEAFIRHRVPTDLSDGKGRTVVEAASSTWIRNLLTETA